MRGRKPSKFKLKSKEKTFLRQADLQLHGFRWWKTTNWDEEAVERALKILWYYQRSECLWQKREVLLAVDEKPKLQGLEGAAPQQALRPGHAEGGASGI